MFSGWPNKHEGVGEEVRRRNIEHTSLCCLALLLMINENWLKSQYCVLYNLLGFFCFFLHFTSWNIVCCNYEVSTFIIVLRWTEFSTFVLQAIRLSLEQALPPEPSEDSGKQISKLRIRTPSGEFLERRFLGSCKLQVLFDFVASKGYPFEEFKLLTTFPRKNVSSHSPQKAKNTYTVITASAGAGLFFVTVESLLWNTYLSDLCDSWNIN